jgi:hypothetical protein
MFYRVGYAGTIVVSYREDAGHLTPPTIILPLFLIVPYSNSCCVLC